MNATREMCAECFGEGRVAKESKSIGGRLVLKKCTTCKGTGVVPRIVNSAFLNNGSIFNQIHN